MSSIRKCIVSLFFVWKFDELWFHSRRNCSLAKYPSWRNLCLLNWARSILTKFLVLSLSLSLSLSLLLMMIPNPCALSIPLVVGMWKWHSNQLLGEPPRLIQELLNWYEVIEHAALCKCSKYSNSMNVVQESLLCWSYPFHCRSMCIWSSDTPWQWMVCNVHKIFGARLPYAFQRSTIFSLFNCRRSMGLGVP